MHYVYVSGSSKMQTLLPSNVAEISPQGFKFCNSVEKYRILLDGNNVWILLEPLTYVAWYHGKTLQNTLCSRHSTHVIHTNKARAENCGLSFIKILTL